MKKQDIKDIIECHVDIIDFLSVKEKNSIKTILDKANIVFADHAHKSFRDMALSLLSIRTKKNKKIIDQAFDIIFHANKHFKHRTFKMLGNDIYKYDKNSNAYVFYQKDSREKQIFQQLINKHGLYIE